MNEESRFHKNLRNLINVVDELRDVGVQRYLNLPRICVVGTQSAGKSSVLEAIVGMDFLPRGDGVVTRRPLELRLVHATPESITDGRESWAIFEEKSDVIFTDFTLVRQTIEELTDQGAGSNKGITADPIVLSIHSVHCPDLTLIDLPGITRVPLKGSDQTDDIERLTRAMASRYARDPRTIILAVIAANTDMSTSDALQLARMEDPTGVRTIGVITKIDLMDKGTDAKKMLFGDDVPLRLGYTGLRNRSQADIKSGKSIQDALKEEEIFFTTHPIYKKLPHEMLGTQALVNKLTKVLFRHIKVFLPDIRRELYSRLRNAEEELQQLGSGVPEDTQKRIHLVWALVTDYCDVFRNIIRGKFDKKIQVYFDMKQLTSGSQIRSIFNELLQDFVDSSVTQSLSDYDIDNAVRMYEGDSLPGFPSPDTFEYLILPYLKMVQDPVFDCLERVAQALDSVAEVTARRVFERFPSLIQEVTEHMSLLVQKQKRKTKEILDSLVTAETGYLFTNDQRYLSQHGAMIPIKEKPMPENVSNDHTSRRNEGTAPSPQPGVLSSPQVNFLQRSAETGSHTVTSTAVSAYTSLQNTVSTMWSGQKKTHYSSSFIKEIRSRLDAYFSIVIHNVRDSVPKIIGYFLVRQLQGTMQYELYHDLNKPEQLNKFLAEPSHLMEYRSNVTQKVNVFNKAIQVLQREPYMNPSTLSDEFDESYDHDLAQLQGVEKPKIRGNAAIPESINSTPSLQPEPQTSRMMTSPLQAANKELIPSFESPHNASFSKNLWGPTSEPMVSGSLFKDRNVNHNFTSPLFTDSKKTNPLYS